MRPTLIAGNWKMNGSLETIDELVQGLKAGDAGKAQLVVFPPSIYLAKVAELLQGSNILIGAQNVCDQATGAFTGEISAGMLLEAGCAYTLVGHSERRSIYQESDELVAKRFVMAKNSGLTPILCIGETLQQRDSGDTQAIVATQLDAVINKVGIASLSGAVIAYEPVWAIGTGKVATAQQAQDVHCFIREKLAKQDKNIAQNIQILYGGSMNAANAAELLCQQDIDGGLIGGASLKADDFLAIAQSA